MLLQLTNKNIILNNIREITVNSIKPNVKAKANPINDFDFSIDFKKAKFSKFNKKNIGFE